MNVVLIMADQLRKNYLGCYGNDKVKTPNIDSISDNGMRFDNCFVTNPVCMPSRMSLFTGQYVHNHQLWSNGVHLPKELPTLGSFLGAHGYATASFGKAHLEPLFSPTSKESPKKYANPETADFCGPYWGFDHVEFALTHATRPIAHYGKWFFAHGGTKEMLSESEFGKRMPDDPGEAQTTLIPESLHDSAFVGTRSAAYVREKAGEKKPFFLTVSFPDPHHPFNPPEETALRYADAEITVPVAEDDDLQDRPKHYLQHQQSIWHPAGPQQITPDMTEDERAYVEESRKLMEKFGKLNPNVAAVGTRQITVTQEERDRRIRNTYAMVELIDRGVGNVLDALRETGQMDDTVIIFTADHGELMGDHGLWKKGPFFYDGLINVPLIISVPGMKAGTTKEMASLVDLCPTVTDLLGMGKPEFCDGVSLLPIWQGKPARESCLVEYRNGFVEHELHANVLIDQNYKFVQYNNGDCELTDRMADLEERCNLAVNPDYASLVCEYQRKLLLMLLNTPVLYPARVGFA